MAEKKRHFYQANLGIKLFEPDQIYQLISDENPEFS